MRCVDTKAGTTGFNRCVDQRSQVNNARRSELDVFAGANGLKKTRCALERAAQGWVTPDKASNTPQKSLTRCVKWGSADIFFFFFFLFLFFFSHFIDLRAGRTRGLKGLED